MQQDTPSRTAWGVANRRAAHQLLDAPPLVLDDPVAVPILGPGAADRLRADRETQDSPFGRAMRAFLVARSRYAEDRLHQAVGAGIRQYVVLGAGLDTFAYRNPFAPQALRVFEVDHPATQQWKQKLLAQAQIPLPAQLRFVSVDFESESLRGKLTAAGFAADKPAFFSWLGVTPYLTLTAFRETLRTIADLPSGTTLAFEYLLDPELLEGHERAAVDYFMARVAQVGEPFQLFFSPQQMRDELTQAGFSRFEEQDAAQLNAAYFDNRTDGLQMYGTAARLVTAWI